MKRKFWLSMLLVMALLACEKDQIEGRNELVGKWKWETSCGGFAGCVNASPDNQKLMIISGADIIINENDTTQSSFKYEITDQYDLDGTTVYEVELNSGAIWTVKVKQEKLVIEYTVFMGSSNYKRIW